MKQADSSAFFLLLLLLFSSPTSSEFVKTVYTSILSTDQVVPSVSSTGGEGVAVCIYNRNPFPRTLDCEVQYDIDPIHGPFYAGIYKGSNRENGPLVYSFDVRLSSNFRQIFFLDTVQLERNISYTIQEQENDFLNGLWYIAITSNEYEFGDIRGALLQEHFLFSRLSNENVIPRIPEETQIDSHGIAVASYSYYNPSKKADFYILHDVNSASSIEIREGDNDEIGASDYVFSYAFPPVIEEVSYTSKTFDKLLHEEQYLQVVSPSFPNGEIRGQLETVNQLPSVSFTARLDGLSVVPSSVSTIARGCALFLLDCSTLELEYLVYHTVTSPTGAWMNLGDRFTDGIKLWPLSRSEGPIYGSRILTSSEVLSFYQQRLYITIESLIYPEGEIRGQISDTYNYFAYITGSQIVPPVTTSGVGCGTFRLNEQTAKGRKFDYDIHFTLPDEEEATVELIHGDFGLDGELMYTLGDSFSSISGSDVFLTKNEMNFVGTEKTYIQIGDSVLAGGRGQIRGQILPIVNPCPILTSNPNEQPNSPTTPVIEIPSYFEWGAAGSLFPNSFFICLFLCSWFIFFM